MDELQDVQLTEIKPLLTNKVSELRGGQWQAAKAHNCAPEPTCKSHIQTKETCGAHLKRVSTPYGPTRQIHTLIHSACTLCSTVHQSELFISARLSRGERKERERARKSIKKKKEVVDGMKQERRREARCLTRDTLSERRVNQVPREIKGEAGRNSSLYF